MKRSSISGVGHKLGTAVPIAADDEPKWRCRVCTFLNNMGVGQCGKCMEPVTEEEQQTLRVRTAHSNALAAASKPDSVPTRRTESKQPKPAAVSESKQSKPAASPPSAPNVSAWPRPQNTAAAPSSVPKSTSSSSVSSQPKAAPKAAPKKTVKATELNKIHKGDLGYTANKANIHRLTQSKLNHDTVAYRAKFEPESKDKGGAPEKGANIVTISDTIHNGFISSAPKKYNRHDETPVDKPLKYRTGGSGQKSSGGGWIGALQAAASTSAVASLKEKNKGKTLHYASVKPMAGGGVSKLAL